MGALAQSDSGWWLSQIFFESTLNRCLSSIVSSSNVRPRLSPRLSDARYLGVKQHPSGNGLAQFRAKQPPPTADRSVRSLPFPRTRGSIPRDRADKGQLNFLYLTQCLAGMHPGRRQEVPPAAAVLSLQARLAAAGASGHRPSCPERTHQRRVAAADAKRGGGAACWRGARPADCGPMRSALEERPERRVGPCFSRGRIAETLLLRNKEA
jgi:hypothetical protein